MGGGGPIYLVRVRSRANWPAPLLMRAGLTRGGVARLPTPTAYPLGPNIEQPDPKLAKPVSEGPDPKPTPDPDPKPTPDSDPNPTPDPELAQISSNSLSGDLAPRILHPVGLLSDNRVVLLVDGGSNHNFLQAQLAISLGLPCRTAPTPLRVMFFHHGRFVEFLGENATTPGLLPQHQFCHLCRHNEGVSHFHIARFPEAPPDSLPIDTPSAVRQNKPWDPGIVL